MDFTLGRYVVGIAILIIIIPPAVILMTEYGNPAITQSLNITGQNVTASFNNGVYNPFVNNVTSGISSSNNLASSSSTLGFALAFILPGIANILKILVNLPLILGSFLLIVLSAFGIAGVSVTLIVTMFDAIGYLFIYSLAVSLWMKYPLWGAQG